MDLSGYDSAQFHGRSPGTSVASFAHGLANIIEHMHLISLPRIHAVHPKCLLSLWSEYQELEDTLLALASLCNRVSCSTCNRGLR